MAEEVVTLELLGVDSENVATELEVVDSENVGCTGFSGISPVEAALGFCSENAEDVVSSFCHQKRDLFEGSPSETAELSENPESSTTSLVELVQGTELEVKDEVGGDDVWVLVIVTVCVPVNPSSVGSMVVVYSLWPGVDQGSSALKLERKGSQSK